MEHALLLEIQTRCAVATQGILVKIAKHLVTDFAKVAIPTTVIQICLTLFYLDATR